MASSLTPIDSSSPPPDLEAFRLRRFLESLGPDALEHHPEASLRDIADILERSPKAVLIDRPGGGRVPLAGNVAGSRERLAHAFHSTIADLPREIIRRLANPPRFVQLAREQAPVQQVVLEGEQCDLTQLPVHLQHGLDGAPYISASIDFVKDTETGWTNVGVRRLMLRGRRTTGIDLVAPSDLRAIYVREAARKRRVPVAFAIGSHPIDHVAATMRVPGDELALLASLRGAPLPVVKCVTNDLLVPADAEYIIEGYLDEAGHVEPEGPYGEFLGYYGVVKKNPLFHVTAITHRRDAIFQTATISGPTMAWTDTAQLNSLRTEVMVLKALETAVRDVRGVFAATANGGMFNVRVCLQQRVPGEARNAIAAVFGSLSNVKHVFVVDPDIDIYSDAEMDWALGTRFQADRDLVVQSGMRAMPLDPSLLGNRYGAKAGFDLTLPLLPPGGVRPLDFRVPGAPTYPGKRFDSIEAALADGPKYFEELMAATGSNDGREIVRWLEDNAGGRAIVRDDEGRYHYA